MTFRLTYSHDPDGSDRLELDVEPASVAEVEDARFTFVVALDQLRRREPTVSKLAELGYLTGPTVASRDDDRRPPPVPSQISVPGEYVIGGSPPQPE